VRNYAEDQPLHAGDLAPVPFECFEHELHTGSEGHEAIRPGADRCFLVAVVADLLDVLLRHDPPGPGRPRPVEGHEVGPGLLEPEPHAVEIEDLHRRDSFLEGLGKDTAIALEGELQDDGSDALDPNGPRLKPRHVASTYA